MPTLLSNTAVLSQHVQPVNYQAEHASCGIVHIGIGAFHRAHQAVFTDDLLATGDSQWKITAVSLRSPDIRNLMQAQNNRYSVVERSAQHDHVRIIGAIDRVLVAPENPAAVIDAIAHESTKVVTITVTEKGYCRDKSGCHLDTNNPLIVHDLTNLQAPKSLPGFIVAACKKRQSSQHKLTIISCDNLPSNGDVTKTVVLEFAEHVDPNLASWIRANVSFCNSMVDRIVPATTAQDIEQNTTVLGVRDNAMVVTEPFKQWVIEDNFASTKPAWDKVGALYVSDVAVFEDMKLRLLNGAHSTLAYMGALLGYEFIHQAVNDKNCLAFVKLLHADLLSTLDKVPNIDLQEYANTILARFANNRVPYKTLQVATDGSQKLPQRLVQPAEILQAKGIMSQPICFVLACWCYFLEGATEQGSAIAVNDPLADTLTALANQHKANEIEQVSAIFRQAGICSDTQLANTGFIHTVARHLSALHDVGLNAALKQYLHNQT